MFFLKIDPFLWPRKKNNDYCTASRDNDMDMAYG